MLYDWAGAYRTVDISKRESLFSRAYYLDQESLSTVSSHILRLGGLVRQCY